MGTRMWISVDVRLPEVPNTAFTVPRIEFKVAGKRYIGEFHSNGCFYAPNIIATTPRARARYTSGELAGMKPATHWRDADLDTDAV
jgi:hypothetical protein